MSLDKYNPLYNNNEDGKEEKIKDTSIILDQQNQIYGAQHWYPLLKEMTPESYLLPLTKEEINKFTKGENVSTDFYFNQCIELLISQGYHFVKTTHKSAHAFQPILNLKEFREQMSNSNIIMSFRRYQCPFLLFRKWIEMNLECRVYVFNKKVHYVEVYRDEKEEFQPNMFPDIIQFVSEQVIGKLNIYDSFTVDLYYKGNKHLKQKEEQDNKINDNKTRKENEKQCVKWNVVEVNSPLWLKCGTYLIDYEWQKDRIHTTLKPICRYKDRDTKEIIEL